MRNYEDDLFVFQECDENPTAECSSGNENAVPYGYEFDENCNIENGEQSTNKNFNVLSKRICRKKVSERNAPKVDQYKHMIMFEKTNLNTCSVLNMLNAVSLRFKFSDEARYTVFDMLKVCSGNVTRDISKAEIGNLLNPHIDKMVYVYFCTKCFIEL